MPIAVPAAPYRPVEPLNLLPQARRVLECAAQDVAALDPGLPVTTVLDHGARVAGIVAATSDAALLVVGRETRHGLERLLTGATTAGIAARAKCPVVVVARDWRPHTDDSKGPRGVVGVRSATHAAEVLESAFAWASDVGGSIELVHVWYLPEPYVDRAQFLDHADEWQARGHAILEEAVSPWHDKYPEVPVQTRVWHGHPASILAHAAEDADLLFVRRAHERRPFEHLGSTVRALLLASNTPVVVVPTRTPAPEADLVLGQSGELVG
jgi:nucleotide-binding universal stress UspA family protein